MVDEDTNKVMTIVSEAGPIREPVAYPEHDDSGNEDILVSEGTITDYITGREVKDSPKERVRQRIERALFHEYGFPTKSMESDFPIPVEVGGKRRRKKVEIAIFDYDQEHTLENLRRVVVCRPEPKNGRKGVTKLRDHQQAANDLEELKEFMTAVPTCQYGLWTNGLDMFFLRKEITRFDTLFEPRADWPLAEESQGSRSVVSDARLRRADPEMLRMAFRRCHNFIHGNEGMPKDAAFWQFLYLIFAKHDERSEGMTRRFYVHPTEPFTTEGGKAIRARIEPLFAEVKQKYGPASDNPIFRGNEEITLSDRALGFLVAELARYDFARTEIDAKGIAYQELVDTNLRGDRGQCFTPRGAISLMVEILDPQEDERVLDSACGTGGFLRETLKHLLERWKKEEGTVGDPDSTQDLLSHQARLARFAEKNLFGADFDPFLVRASSMNLLMVANTTGNVFHMDSLAFPQGYLPGVEPAQKKIPLESIDVLMTNPPFGSDIPITDPQLLDAYKDGVARSWRRKDDGSWIPGEGRLNTVAPEILFIQRSVEWLREEGHMGIVLPDGILGNPGDEPIRRWILKYCWVLASVDLPVETFIVEANVNILTSLLFLKKKTYEERIAEDLNGPVDYPVFMAVAEKVGVDRRGNTLYKRSPDGEIILEEQEARERKRINGKNDYGTLKRKVPIVDNDLPEIARAYHEFRKQYPEPGMRRKGARR
jgi:type I restriction enzyme M protein